jgi:transposase
MNQTTKQGKRYSPTIKFQAALEVIKGKEPGQVGKAYDVHPTSITSWKNHILEHGPELFSTKTTVKQQEHKLQQLEMLLGKKEVEIAFLKNVLEIND